MMMDDGINVDDLFGEPASLELGLPSSTSIKGLAQRLDELRLSGCCQKIAWSRQGCIAYITHDTLGVNLRHLECRPSDGKWILSEDTPLSPVTEAHDRHPLVHLSWNEVGSELAVADSSGRVSIYNIAIALNNLSGQRHAHFDPDDDGGQIVGMMWLNIQRSVHAFNQAAKVQGRWAYSPFRRRPIGPLHPAGKAALVCVTKSGMIRLLYQNPDGKWAEISAELKSTAFSDRSLTHAAIGAVQGGIVIATHSACQKLCFYRAQINWTPAQWDPSQLKHPPNPSQYPVPNFRFMHAKVESSCNLPSLNRDEGQDSNGVPQTTNSLYCLTHLDIIMAAHDSPSGMTTNPWIVAVFSIPPHAVPDHSQQLPAGVIVRWQLESAPQVLHPKFDEVTSKKNSVQMKPKTALRRLEDIPCDKYVISIDQTEFGNVLAITYDDSTITFYDPKTMAILNGNDDANTVTSLAQAGFNYPPDTPGLYIGFSPSGCIAMTLDNDGQPQLRVMEHTYGVENGISDESKLSAAIASLTLAFCRGCGSELNTDDILMILRRQVSPDDQATFVNEVYRALAVNCNFTQENDKLMSHQYLPRCLSIQAALGFKDKYKSRTFASNVPWTILQLRHASVLYALFIQFNKGTQNEAPDPDALRILLGNTKWALDFLHFVLNDLLDLADEFEDVFSDQEAFAQKLKTATSLPLIILLSSMSRAFLRFICRGLRGIYAGYATAPLTGDARIYYAEVCQTIDTSPVRIDVYEKFIAGVDSAVRHGYHGAGFGDAERPGPERELLVNARISPVLVPAVATILRQTVPGLKSDIDRLAIYTADYSWLGLGTDRRAEMYRRTRDVDIIKKIPVRVPSGGGDAAARQNAAPGSGPARRRCVRCCEILCGTYPPRPYLSFRMLYKLGYVRYCICGGGWACESEGK
ncbi:mediator of RNA polymerase II transcription subunit 16 [Aspergillus affinis]|uniref:mediator of RNA polymerase II transcription subunit 16 n=1 Tax=Aspergillus affinis TaxID=1070780 RepID=UPI0022FF41C5|nr:uncharacterized protein KD926_006702 [Aspergillus affinis]KAI9041628.1 hypothetical protein KD926_006702 [Aspergillus affinis]